MNYINFDYYELYKLYKYYVLYKTTNFYILDIRICAYYKMPAGCTSKCANFNKDEYCCTFAQDPNLRQKWINAARIPDWKPSKSVLLCEIGTEVCM